jgi:hypothetical protein
MPEMVRRSDILIMSTFANLPQEFPYTCYRVRYLLWVREDKLLDLVRGFFSRRIFGPNREALLAATPPRSPPSTSRPPAAWLR